MKARDWRISATQQNQIQCKKKKVFESLTKLLMFKSVAKFLWPHMAISFSDHCPFTFIVSKGWPTTTVHMPPNPPGNNKSLEKIDLRYRSVSRFGYFSDAIASSAVKYLFLYTILDPHLPIFPKKMLDISWNLSLSTIIASLWYVLCCMIHLQMCSWTHWLSVSHSSSLSCFCSLFTNIRSPCQLWRLWRKAWHSLSCWHRLQSCTRPREVVLSSRQFQRNQLICTTYRF